MLARLRAVSILSGVPDSEARCLCDSQEVQITEGHFIAHQGEAAHFFWILLTGEMRVFQTLPEGSEHTMATMSAGAAFGELPLLSNTPYSVSVQALRPSELLQFNEQQFWNMMTACPNIRKAILGNMALRFQKFQSTVVQQEKMASLGTLAAGLMHELNNPGTAAVRAAAQLRDNLMRMHRLTAKFSKANLSDEQKHCMFELQEYALNKERPLRMNSLEQSDAEETLAEWMENAEIEEAWKLAPTLVSVGITPVELTCAREEFPGPFFSDALSWLEALVSSIQLVETIEESIGRVSELVKAVKSYAYEGKGKLQAIDINESIHATLIILAHKVRQKQITLDKKFGSNLPPLQCECSGLNQIWTNLLDNAIDAAGENGVIRIRTWKEDVDDKTFLSISIADNGPGIPPEIQAHIFDPFYTTKPVGVGTGLGLGIVQRIVEQYKGTIAFTSEPGNTEFHVRIPLRSS